MTLAGLIATKKPHLKKQLRMARISKSSEQIVGESLKFAFMWGIFISILLFFIFLKEEVSLGFLIPTFIVLTILFYKFNMLKISAAVTKRRKEIDRDVLFAGRYLLVKLNSGQPLMNALVDASKSYGVANKYFKEIVREIELGKPLEQAIAEESEFSPSKKFQKILFQISNALKIGIDVTEFLEATLDEIADEQLIEIKRYGKKLNSITLFYMLFAIVMPSLGLTILILVLSLSGTPLDTIFFFIALFFLGILQLMFLSVYKSIRPNINI